MMNILSISTYQMMTRNQREAVEKRDRHGAWKLYSNDNRRLWCLKMHMLFGLFICKS